VTQRAGLQVIVHLILPRIGGSGGGGPPRI
jgi:hypothetical protein